MIRLLGAGSLAVTLLFTANRAAAVWGGTISAEPEGTQPATEATTAPTQALRETLAVTVPEDVTEEALATEETAGEEALWRTLEEAAADMAASCVFAYDTAAERMLYCSTGQMETVYPASITKLFSAWMALQYLEPEEVITAGDELSLVRSGSSSAYINRGSRLTVEMLVEGMLLPSGNDAAYVLAAAAGRAIALDPELGAAQAVETFVAEMNREAYRLGLENTHFTNPDGYHDEEHYTCPADISLVAALSMEDPVISRYVGLQQDTVTFKSGEWITWYNTNGLLDPSWEYYIPTALGMKTGYTGEAGYCLLGAFPGGGEYILIGIFGGETKNGRYVYAAELLELIQGE